MPWRCGWVAMAGVSHFSNALKAAVQSLDKDQLSFAARLDMDASQFNKYCNGRARVGQAMFLKILAVFPADLRGALIKAYLQDRVPPAYRHQMQIKDLHGSAHVAEEEAEVLEQLPPKARKALRQIAQKCHERPVLDLVLNLARLLSDRK